VAPPKKTASRRKTASAKKAPPKKPAKSKAAPKTKASAKTSLPSKKEVIEFLAGTSSKAGKREIARAFGIKGSDRIGLKALLREMADEDLIAGSRRKLSRPGTLP